ncbi:MAG: hypothetical protein ABFD52_08975 [Acidobacteriota bacterium]
MADSKRKKVGVGWARTSQDGTKKYVSIVINGGLSPDINLVMFQNGFKEKDGQPDFILYLNAPKEASAEGATAKAGPAEFPGEEGAGPGPDDDIPF